jgi:DNA-binding transcriptional ArsR family regulator
LAPELPAMAEPDLLIGALRSTDPRVLALRMLDTGETSSQTLDTFERSLAGASTAGEVDAALHGLAPEWARRCRRVLADPVGVKDDLVDFLERYHASVFDEQVLHLRDSLARAQREATDLLALLPTIDAIERLTGGYTLGEDLRLRRIVLAPSVFIYPFMSSRVDEASGDALIVYGVRTSAFLKYEQVPIDPNLVGALKALADPARLKVVRLIGQRPMYGPELVKALGLTQQTVHHHLAQLRAAGLVRQERTKGGMRYTIRADSAGATLAALERVFSGGN